MSDHTLSEIFAVLNANDTYRKLEKVLQRGMRLSDDYQIFLFAYLAHGYGLKDQKGHALNPTYSRTPILFTSEEMHVLQVAADVVKRQPSFNAQQLRKSLIYHRGESPKTPPSIVDGDEDGDSDLEIDEMLEEDKLLKDHGYIGKSMNEQNPYCILLKIECK